MRGKSRYNGDLSEKFPANGQQRQLRLVILLSKPSRLMHLNNISVEFLVLISFIN